MKKFTYWGLIRVLCVILCFFSLTACAPQDSSAVTDPIPTETVEISSLWRDYTFEDAVERAAIIVYGTVTAKTNTQIYEYPLSDGTTGKDPYRNVTVNVETLIKGDSSLTSVVYKELGGVIDSIEYRHTGFELLAVGDKVLLFLNPDNYFLTPDGLYIADEDGNTSVSSDMLPVTPGQTRSSPLSYTSMPIGDYCDIIRDYLAE